MPRPKPLGFPYPFPHPKCMFAPVSEIHSHSRSVSIKSHVRSPQLELVSDTDEEILQAKQRSSRSS